MGATVGRYGDSSRASMPGELPSRGRVSDHCQIEHGAVDDPNPTFRGQRQKAAINIRTDALEFEYARARIGEAAYRAARTYQAVLLKSRGAPGGGGWTLGDRVDQVISHETKVLDSIVKAQDAQGMIRETAPVLGLLAQRVFELVLVDGMTLGEAATRIRGRADRQGTIFVSELFRRGCEALADHWCSRRGRAPRA